jgi:predicted RNA-binding protein YlxR (DUF448 family)
MVTRARAPKEELLRLTLDPDGKPFVDLLARAPGRGVYVSPSSLRDALTPKGLGRIFKGRAARVSEEEIEAMVVDTAHRIEARIVELIGLARRAGALELGMDSVSRSLAANRVCSVVVARDASDRTVRRVEESLGSAALVRASTKEELGRMLGRDEVGVVAVHPSKLADRISAESKRLAGLTSSDASERSERSPGARALPARTPEDEG